MWSGFLPVYAAVRRPQHQEDTGQGAGVPERAELSARRGGLAPTAPIMADQRLQLRRRAALRRVGEQPHHQAVRRHGGQARPAD